MFYITDHLVIFHFYTIIYECFFVGVILRFCRFVAFRTDDVSNCLIFSNNCLSWHRCFFAFSSLFFWYTIIAAFAISFRDRHLRHILSGCFNGLIISPLIHLTMDPTSGFDYLSQIWIKILPDISLIFFTSDCLRNEIWMILNCSW